MGHHSHTKAYLALASVCFFWGTTYLGIKMALESFEPLWLVAGRFLISGALMLAIVRTRGMTLPRGRELWKSALYGVMILGIGNGCLVFSERLIASSLAALFIAASPFWMVGLEALVPGGEPLRRATVGGMLLGFAGASLLVAPSLIQHGMHGAVWQGFLLLQLGSSSWSLGSILQKRQASTAHPVATGAIQQFAAGAAFLGPALLFSEPAVNWSARGVGAAVYLVIFGSLVGYSSYIYALEHLPVAVVSMYTYINPVVAAVLGWIVYRERFGGKEMAAMTVIFLGVALVKRAAPRPAVSATPSREPSRPELRRSSAES